ncbi:MAG: helix-turn-helix transcriptional regulator [Eubacterium sp.]|jgi:transcriptional regulator with XRE-family HTH domain|nr:helix-turn-helix transcriptional regulator [Eubacterium sp.]
MDSTIASILKQLRKSAKLSVKQASDQLKQYGIDIASKTLYGYESGLSMPNADVFVALCNIYHCGETGSILSSSSALSEHATQNEFAQNKITQDEITLLNDFKTLDSFGQALVRQVMEHEKERVRQMNGVSGG